MSPLVIGIIIAVILVIVIIVVVISSSRTSVASTEIAPAGSTAPVAPSSTEIAPASTAPVAPASTLVCNPEDKLTYECFIQLALTYANDSSLSQKDRDELNKASNMTKEEFISKVPQNMTLKMLMDSFEKSKQRKIIAEAETKLKIREKVCVGLIGKYPMIPRVSWSKDGKETYPVALRNSVYTPFNCDQYYEGTTGNPINGPVSIDEMCSTIKQIYPNVSLMGGNIRDAYNDSCSTNTMYQVPQYIRHNNLYRIMTSRLNLQP